MRTTAISALALCLAVVLGGVPASIAAQEGSGPPPAPPAPSPADDDAAKAAAEAQAARERLAKAVEEVRVAEEKALRAERRALEKDLAAREDEVDRLRAAGDREGAARAGAEVAVLAGRLSAVAARLAGGVRAAIGPPAAAFTGRSRSNASEGLPPPRTQPGDRPGAVDSALDWLARHQGPGGYWDCDDFTAMCREEKCRGPGGPLYDPGVTGLATLAFLGAGETLKTPKHGPVVTGALKYLKGIQDAEGCFGARTPSHFTYNQAMGTLAMAEAYGLTGSPLFKDSAQRGVDFILQCRNPYLGWRYGVQPGDNDTAVTGWMVMALKSAKGAGLTVDEGAFKGALAWVDKVTDPGTGRAGYTARGNGPARPMELMDRFPTDRSEAMTAEAILARILCGTSPGDAMVRKGADLCLAAPPAWDRLSGRIDFYYWYFGTLATFQVGGEHWRRWSEAMTEALLPNQRGDADGCARGSWDPVDPWGVEGGRVYSTAVNALSLEVYYRYARVFGGK